MDNHKRISNILDYLEDAARYYPEKIAFQSVDGQITYAELLEKVNDMGYQLARRFSVVRQPIVVLMDKCVECLIAFFAVVASGNFYVCVDDKMVPERIRKILENLQPAGIIKKQNGIGTGKDSYANIPVMLYEEIVSECADESEALPVLKQIREGMIDTDPLYVLYTSGSTGIPKGSVISHQSVIAYAEWVTETFQIHEGTVFGSQTPFYFSMSVLDIYATIRNAATMQIIPKKFFSFPIRLLEYLREKKVNTIYWVPSALSIVADWKALDYVKVPELHTILFAGEVMPTKQLNIWRSHIPNALYANLFGPTEITDIGLYYILDREFKNEEPIPIGKSCRNMNAFAINEKGSMIEKGETGELYFRGSFVGYGYYNNMEKTREVFVQNPLNSSYPEIVYRTGDLVRENEYGEYVYLGRKDFQIKHMGYRIELGEIENAVSAFEKIERAVCIYRSSKDHIVLFYQGKTEEEEIIVFLKELLPSYMLPNEMIHLRSMPLNANGKIDRVLLTENYLEGN